MEYQTIDVNAEEMAIATLPYGAGGLVGKSGQPPDNEDDTLYGRGVANAVGLIGEGKLEGFPTQTIWNGQVVSTVRKNHIYLNGTQIIYPGSSNKNFKRARVKYSLGTANQKPLKGFTKGVSTDIGVNVIVKRTSGDVIRSFVNNQVDVIRVNVAVRMYKQDKNISGTRLHFEIWIQRNSEGFVRKENIILNEQASDYAPMSYDIAVDNQDGASANWSIKLVKITPDGDSKTVNDLQWLSYGQIVQTKLQYRHTSILAAQLDSETFSSFPDVTVDQMGITELTIPLGVTIRADRTLSYTGVNWTGATAIADRTVNDIFPTIINELTNPRINRFPLRLDQIDLSDLFEISRWNSALITHQDGIQRPRFKLTFYLADDRTGFDLLTELCSSCFANYYWADGKLRFWQNRQGLPTTQQFSNADVLGGEFDYPETPIDSRFNVCRASWWNPETNEEDEEIYEDSANVSINGYRETRVTALGCENRYQAWLYAKAVVKTSLLEYRYCNFTAAAKGLFCRPGQILTIYDENMAQVRNAGLLKAWNGSTLFTLDSPTTAIAGDAFRYIGTDGSVQSLIVASVNTTLGTVTTTVAATIAPQIEATWAIAGSVQAGLFRVETVSIDENDPDQVQITTINNVSNLWDVIESDAEPLIPKTRGDAPPDAFPVLNLSAALLEVDVSGYDLNPNLYTLWSDWTEPKVNNQANPYIRNYLAEFRVLPDGEWTNRQEIPKETTEVRYPGLQLGRYQTRVTAVDIYGRLGGWVLSPEVLTSTTGVVDSSATVVSGSPSNYNYPNKVLLALKVQNLENISLKILNTGSIAITEVAIAFSSHSSQSRLLSSGLIDSINPNYYSSGTSAGIALTGVNNAITANNFGMPILYATSNPGNISPGGWSHININTIGWESIYILARTTSGTTTAKVIHSGKPVSFKYW
jgi:predicted phage tail protein